MLRYYRSPKKRKNMFRLDNILEDWASAYRPLSNQKQRDAKHRTFFRISMIDGNSEFVRNFTTTPSPAMAYATHIDAELAQQNPKAITYRHVIYFMVKQAEGGRSKTIATDEDAATEARFETDEMVQDLLAVLKAIKGIAGGKTLPATVLNGLPVEIKDFIQQTADNPEYAQGLRGLQLDGARWGTLPVYLNGWQVCGLTIEQISPRLLCINPEKYIQDNS